MTAPAACGDCGKPFTPARKCRGYVRLLTESAVGIALTQYPVCGRCRKAAAQRKRDGLRVANQASLDDARRAHNAARLYAAPAQGNG